MKASEVIQLLQQAIEKYGDILVIMPDPTCHSCPAVHVDSVEYTAGTSCFPESFELFGTDRVCDD